MRFTPTFGNKLLGSSKTLISRRTKKTKKYPIECSSNHLRILMRQSNWNTTNNIIGFFKLNYYVDMYSKVPIQKGSFTRCIKNSQNNMIKFNVGDTVQIWSSLQIQPDDTLKRVHGTCVIWSDGHPYSFGISLPINKKLMLESPDYIFEERLMSQKSKNPTLNVKKETYLELNAMGILTQPMINKLEEFFNNTKYVGDKYYIQKGLGSLTLNNSVLTSNPTNQTPINTFISMLKKKNPILTPISIHETPDKQYCSTNRSRKSQKFNCYGALDTIFKEIISCRTHGFFAKGEKCIAKKPCKHNTSYSLKKKNLYTSKYSSTMI